jgi:hypothetical protein
MSTYPYLLYVCVNNFQMIDHELKGYEEVYNWIAFCMGFYDMLFDKK